MNEFRTWIGKASTLAIAASLCAIGHAQTTGQLDIMGSFDSGPWDSAAGSVEGSYGGPFSGTYTPTGSSPVNLSMFCLSVPDGFYFNQPFDVEATLEFTQAGWLVDNADYLTVTNGIFDGANGFTDSLNAENDALQLAIWSVTPGSNGAVPYDPTLSGIVTSGPVIPTSLYAATSEDYQLDMAKMGTQAGSAYYFNVNYTYNNGQPQIAPHYPGSPNHFNIPGAPGPAAAIPFAVGLVGRLRRRKAAKA